MERKRRSLLLLLLFVLSVGVSKGRVSIPDDLDDVLDDEEDEAWKEWGRRKRSEPEEEKDRFDPSKLTPSELETEMIRRHTGPTIGFVKIRLGLPRSREDAPEIAMKWSKVLRTGSIEVKFMAVDLSTIMFNMDRGQDIEELKEFVLSQPEAYEIKIGKRVYRRPGDPPLEEVIEMLQRQKSESGGHNPTKDSQHVNDEL